MPFPSFASWDAVSAIATSVAALGVFLAFWQVRLSRSIAQLQFEDALSCEYRDLCTTIPAAVFLRRDISEKEYQKTFDEFYRYIDLSNEQISLRQRDRISKVVWESWREGIRYNLQLKPFARAWAEVKASAPESFRELRELEAAGFIGDPKSWRQLRSSEA